MKIGDRVYFGRQFGERTLGEVVKINRRTIAVRQLEARGTMRAYPVGTVWRVPPAFVYPADGSAQPAPSPAPSPGRPESVILQELRGIEGQLSPENLSCDGELPMSAVRRRAAQLNRAKAALLAELGRPVTDKELWGY